MSIEVKHLLKVYGEQKAVNDISFSVSRGEIVGFLGPNGAGKSTTMKILTGYLQPTSGEAYICGMRVSSHSPGTKKKTGYLPESNPLYYDMYVREYLGFMADIHKVANKKAAVERMIDLVGLTPEKTKKIGQLSKGYKQRVGLAAALIYDPEVLILDEPTTGLDPNQIVEIREVIRNLGRDKTVLFSSHILQEVEAICSRVIIINKGELVADDTIASLQSGNNGTHSIIVAFGETPALSVFDNIAEIISIQPMPGNELKFSTSRPEHLRKRIIESSLENNLNIVSMRSETQSLETVFKALTGNNTG